MNSDAAFDRTGRYRYRLWRQWNHDLPRLAWIMLNPSRADAITNDQTIRSCLGLAHLLNFGAIEVVNLFAYMATDPRALRKVRDPVGADNDRFIIKACRQADATVLAWGNHGRLHQRADNVLDLLKRESVDRLYTFGVTKQGQPRHPLYLKRSTALCPFDEIDLLFDRDMSCGSLSSRR